MNEINPQEKKAAEFTPDEKLSATFLGLVSQQLNMAFMFLGKIPHPETGQAKCDLEAAQFFIDQLEMLQAKTKGNLDKKEEAILRQALTAVRMEFIEAVEKGQPSAPTPAQPAAAPQTSAASTPSAEPAPEASAAADQESRKKFSKKYD